MTTCFCTLAIHAPYRKRARLLCADAPNVPWRVLTDEPDEFAGLPVRAVRYAPTGPMAVDYLILQSARWCHETCIAVTKDGHESDFFGAWGRAAEFLQARGVYSGEGGVVGLAAAFAGWTVDYEALARIASVIQHEGEGPKDA